MGVFGPGLYAGDYAMDLRTAIRAVSRLPFDGNHLLDLLRKQESAVAEDPNNEDHTTFWLVVADQFAKRNIACATARDRALAIINDGTDLALFEELGMEPPDLRKRKKVLEELRVRLVAPPVFMPRPTLKKPQPLLMQIGDVLVYPTCEGYCINPYFSSTESQIVRTAGGLQPWARDGWGGLVVVDAGYVFEFLAWYRFFKMASSVQQLPTMDDLRGPMYWRLCVPGTCSPSHFKRMQLEKIGSLPVDRSKVAAEPLSDDSHSCVFAAVNDISIANSLNTTAEYAPSDEAHAILGIDRILP